MLKLYTRNVCPKCFGVKAKLEDTNLDYEIINIDQDELAKSFLIGKSISAVPILNYGEALLTDLSEIYDLIDELSE